METTETQQEFMEMQAENCTSRSLHSPMENVDSWWFSEDLVIAGTDEQRAAMFEAMAKYYAEVTNPENTTVNTFFKQKYAPLNEVLNSTRPVMAKYGLTCTQTTGVNENQECMVSTLLTHAKGGYIYYPALVAKAEKSGIQAIGATITYLRRFALNAVAGVCGEVDDDGNTADGAGTAKTKATKPLSPRQELAAVAREKTKISRKKVTDVIKSYAESGDIKDIPDEKLEEVKTKLEEIA